MTYDEIIRRLRARGFVLKRRTKGSHEIWHDPQSNRSCVIPKHKGDLPAGTLHAIVKQIGLKIADIQKDDRT